MLAAAPILDPVRWVQAFEAIPSTYKGVALALLALYIVMRYRRRNGKD